MTERSRDEKLAAAKKKLKKFQENTFKEKIKDETLNNLKTKKILDSNSILNSKNERQEYNKTIPNICSQNPFNSDIGLPLEEPTATTESLKQISRHLNGIISCSSSSIERESQQEHLNTIRELEKRNVELASFNSQKAEQIEFLNAKVVSLNDNLERITFEFNSEKFNVEDIFRRQIESIQNQLQAQIQTISLLVAEKSELQSQVTHNQKLANQRFQEIEDLTNKLKTLRQRFGDLEKSFNDVKLLSEKSEEAKRDMLKQLEQTRFDLKKLKTEKDDLFFESSQLRSKLASKTQELSNLEITLDDIKSELEMSQVQIQHLTNNQEGHYDNLCLQLKATEKKNTELTIELGSAMLHLQQYESQNNKLQIQYRSYFDQMEEKLRYSQSQILIISEERNNLIKNLELMKADFKNSEIDESINQKAYYENIINDLENEKSLLVNNNKSLENSNMVLKENNLSLLNKKDKLEKKVEANEIKIGELLEKIKQFESSQLDYTQLLSQLQSDKTALSRALSQNKLLKFQLVELQEAFVKLSSDNMDFSTQLQHEKYISKELASRLGEQEDDLNEIRQTLLKKDEEISKLINTNRQITEELLTINNTENLSTQRSASHFKMANKVVIENLQNDLINSQEKINQLTTENNTLTCKLNQSTENFSVSYNKDTCNDNSLIVSLRQIEAERDELLAKCEDLRRKENCIIEAENNNNDAVDNGFIFSRNEIQHLHNSNFNIDDKLVELENKNIKLVKENQRLEHLVEQLEGETDTIAEYISLYQHQRSLLKQKCISRDQLMSKLMHQKQLIENKLIILENLFRSILKSDTKDYIHGIASSDDKPKIISFFVEDNKLLIIDKIFSIIHELQNPLEIISESCKNQINRHEEQKFDSSLLSDDLLHYHIIHCKCCVGKIIDL